MRERAEEVRSLVADALNEVRELAPELRPIVLDDVGLVAAVRRLASDLAERNDFAVDVALEGLTDDTRLPGEIETVVFRVVQEALTNVTRHARAHRVRISVVVADGRLRVDIVDDGTGFDPGAAAHRRSLGVTGMTERAALAGGKVQITSAPGAGTTVHLDVPVG